MTDPPQQANPHVAYLRKTVKLAAQPVAKARLFVTALGLYQIDLNGRRVGDLVFAPEWTDYRQRLRYQVYDVTAMLAKGDNVLAGLVGQGWYSGHIGLGGFKHYGQIPALLAQLEITYNVTRLGTFTPVSMNVMVLRSRPAFCAKASFDKPSLRRWDTKCSATRRANCCSSGNFDTWEQNQNGVASEHQRIL